MLKVTRGVRVDVPPQYQEEEGCIAFQSVLIEYDFFGTPQRGEYDTKILMDGRQVIHNGDGFFPDGTELPEDRP